RVTGVVQVEVIVDENGKVVSARVLSGPGTLRDVAMQAALRARFSPTKLSGQSVKVSGQINYNFTLP
ncbi:MAG: energy transducer TonB, partial [Acidobacteriota bacterium]